MNETPETIRRPEQWRTSKTESPARRSEIPLKTYFRRVQSAHDGVLRDTDGELASGEVEFDLNQSDIEAVRAETRVDVALQENAGKLKSLRDKTLAALEQTKKVVTSEEFSQGVDFIPVAGSAKMAAEAVVGKTLSGKKLEGQSRINHGVEGTASLGADLTGFGALGKAAKLGKAALKSREIGKVRTAGKVILKEGGKMVERGKKRQEVARGQGKANDIERDASEAGVQEREAHVAKCFEEGLNNPDIAAYHGCSLEVLKYLIEEGKLPGSNNGSRNAENTKRREVFVFPVGAETGYKPRVGFSGDAALEGSSTYAAMEAQSDAFFKSLGLDRFDEKVRKAGITMFDAEANDENVLERLKKVGINVTKRDVMRALNKAHSIEDGGVVLGLSKRMFEDFKSRSTEGGNDVGEQGEIAVATPDGLQYKYVIGLEPLDQTSYDFLTALQKRGKEERSFKAGRNE